MTLSKKQRIGLAVVILAGLSLLGYAAVNRDIVMQIINLVNDKTPTPLFIALMIVLPIFGVPVSFFLVVLGMKFGLAGGMALMLITMPIHMTISFALVKIAGNLIKTILSRKNYLIPQVPADRQIRFAFLVSALPVLPYAVKNFLPPLAGIPFRLYLGMNWGCQAVLATPTVVLGSSIADLNSRLFLAAMAIMVTIYLVISRIEKKYGKQIDLKEEKTTAS